jgi:diguanylate cyclase (GGDEF)-like protein
LPALLITLSAALLYQYHAKLPATVQETMELMPYLLLATVLLLAIFFNQGQLFYLSMACFFSWMLFEHALYTTPQLLELCFIALVLIISSVGLIAEKGLFTLAAWKIHLLVGMVVALAYGSWVRQTHWLDIWQSNQLFPDSWFQWIELSQWSLLLFLLCIVVLLVFYRWQQQRKTYHAAMTLIAVLLMFCWQDNNLALLMICSGGLLLLLMGTFQQSWHLAYIDELTGLPGRRALEERLQRSLGIYALAMVDVDHFKKFNDSYGHDVGDDVLRMIAAKIAQVGGGGKAYRYGGEEFTIVFGNHSSDEVKSYLQEVIAQVADTPFVVNRRKNQKPKTVKVTISIGLTDSINKSDAAATIKVADQALYTAKKKGRNRLQLKS